MSVKGQIKDVALVIRSIRHGETSRITTLFAKINGKVAVIAKGARRGKSGAAGGTIEIPNLIEAIIYFKPSRSVQILGNVTTIEHFPCIKSDLVLTGYASVVAEMLNHSFTDGEADPEVFNAAVETLNRFEEKTLDARIILWLFQLSLLRLIGFAIDPLTCPICMKQSSPGYSNIFLLDAGAICCNNCQADSGASISISGESVGVLRQLVNGNHVTIKRLKVSNRAKGEITKALERYMRHHHPGISRMPALKMLDKFEEM
ncbi:MAG: DNA repair protein RecO [Calditrichaeota bacterium]|nr:DNA repair protein RecO [Calditrichota bacterium]